MSTNEYLDSGTREKIKEMLAGIDDDGIQEPEEIILQFIDYGDEENDIS